MKKALLIFVKNAVKGKVKTRLAATLGDDLAFEVYNALLTYTQKCTQGLQVNKTVYYSDVIETSDIWNDEVYEKQIQQGSNLGERMYNGFEKSFANGYNCVAVIGSDCFEITNQIIEDAFVKLQFSDVVLGPALDGGYYLLAMKASEKKIFEKIEWSTGKVLQQTLDICQELGLKTVLLPQLSDIDTAADLKRSGYTY